MDSLVWEVFDFLGHPNIDVFLFILPCLTIFPANFCQQKMFNWVSPNNTEKSCLVSFVSEKCALRFTPDPWCSQGTQGSPKGSGFIESKKFVNKSCYLGTIHWYLVKIILIGWATCCVGSGELLSKATAATPTTANPVLNEMKPSYIYSILKPH